MQTRRLCLALLLIPAVLLSQDAAPSVQVTAFIDNEILLADTASGKPLFGAWGVSGW